MSDEIKRVFVSAPFSHSSDRVSRERNRQVAEYCLSLAKAGISTFSPLMNCFTVWELDLKEEVPYQYWMDTTLAFFEIGFDEMHVLKIEGWEESTGVQVEIAEANKRGIPVRYATHYPRVGLAITERTEP